MVQDRLSVPARPWAASANAVASSLQVTREHGLAEREVARRRTQFGPNQLRAIRTKSALTILLHQGKSLLVALLAVAAAVSFVFGEWIEGLAVVMVLAINTAIGFITELRAVRSMEALRRMGNVRATVRRDGTLQSVPAAELVPGDIVVVEGGDAVSADMRLLQESGLQVDESSLTGESVPVGKGMAPVPEDAAVTERRNMLYKGTLVTRGSAEAAVVATGMGTELGQISRMVEEADEEATPLEERLNRLGQGLVWVTLIVAAGVGALGLLTGRDPLLIIETAIALAVAGVPEGLPIIATIALARGMKRMAEQNALVTRLSAVETLGATSVIFTDKTGTLTENKMTVTELVVSCSEVPAAALEAGAEGRLAERDTVMRALGIGALCNNAGAEGVGDPLEVALLVAAGRGGITREALAAAEPRVHETAFDSEVKMMATVHRQGGAEGGKESAARYRVAVKGAPEAVIAASTHAVMRAGGEAGGERVVLTDADRARWLRANEDLARRGRRVLALAEKWVESLEALPYSELTLVALVGLIDPPRAEVKEAVRRCRDAGVRVVMVTGDQPLTGCAIGHAVGIAESDIHARVSPREKLDLISRAQAEGAVVAMTGDGVNDAPALKKADIGVAMGLRGTEVAREAADMVLTDDALGTIAVAIEEGRVIFENIRKVVVYLLSCNLSEILVIALATALGTTLPLMPLQILFLNLATDVLPALALGVGPGDPSVMSQPPRPASEDVLTRRHWRAIFAYGALITSAVLGAFFLALGPMALDEARAVSVAFATLALAQLWQVFNLRSQGSPLLVNGITKNRYLWAALAACVLLIVAALHVPVLARVLSLQSLDREAWGVALGMSLLPLVLGQLGAMCFANRKDTARGSGNGSLVTGSRRTGWSRSSRCDQQSASAREAQTAC